MNEQKTKWKDIQSMCTFKLNASLAITGVFNKSVWYNWFLCISHTNVELFDDVISCSFIKPI